MQTYCIFLRIADMSQVFSFVMKFKFDAELCRVSIVHNLGTTMVLFR